MHDPSTMTQLDQRIAITRENLRTLVEQAAGLSGAASESRIADRIEAQETELKLLQLEQDAVQRMSVVKLQKA